MEARLINVPDHLRTALWGWSWNKRTWPAKKSQEDGFYRVFLDQMKQILAERPEAKHFLARARFHVRYGDIDSAINDYSRVIRLNPRELHAIAERGDLYLIQKRDDEALHDYLVVFKKLPEEKVVQLKLAYVYLHKGDMYDAEFHYRESGCKESHPSAFKLIGDYLKLAHKKAVEIISEADKHCRQTYSEENLLERAKAKELGYDLAGAAEDYMMLFLLFEKPEYSAEANRVKQRILDLRLNRKRLGLAH